MRYERAGTYWTLRIMDNGAVSLTDNSAKVTWGGGQPGWVTLGGDGGTRRLALAAPSSIHRTPNGARIRYELPEFAFDAVWTIDGARIELCIEQVRCDGRMDTLEYPAHMLRVDTGLEGGYVAVPHKQGTLIPSRLDSGFMRHRHNSWQNICDIDRTMPFEFCGLNMNWFGAHQRGSSVFCLMHEGCDSSLRVVGNAVMDGRGEPVDSRQGDLPGERYSSLSPIWNASHGELGYSRRMSLSLVDGGYVGMCKAYRAHVQSTGRFVSLKEKVARNPAIEGMLGAPDLKVYIYTNRRDEPRLRSWSEPVLDGYECVHTTFDQAGEIVDDMKRSGVEHALVLLGGWNRAGYDREHIDMWPPAEKAGGVAGLRALSERATKAGYVFSLHDNYQDIYPDSPSYDDDLVMKHEDGSVKLGGIWDGGLCRLVCSSQALKLAKPVVEAVKQNTSVNSYYLDTTTSAPMYECYDESHPMTRRDDRANKLALLEMLSDQGWVVGAEAGVDWAVPVCSFFEGMPGSAVGLNSGAESAGFGMMAPLFNLVYHDAVVCYWQHGQPFGREDHINHVLHDLLSAQPSSWSIIYEQWADLKPLFLQCYELLGKLHRKLAHDEMIRHELPTGDFMLHRSTFEGGARITVNFDIIGHELDGERIPPKGFMVEADGEKTVGCLSRDIVYR